MTSEEEKKELKSDSYVVEVAEDDEHADVEYWRSFCFLIDPRAVKYFSTLVLSLIVTCFSMYQLIHLDKCDSSEYQSLLMLVLGVYLNPGNFSGRVKK